MTVIGEGSLRRRKKRESDRHAKKSTEREEGQVEEKKEEEEEEENVVTSFVEGACAPILRTFGSSASTRLKCRDDVKARAIVRQVISLR